MVVHIHDTVHKIIEADITGAEEMNTSGLFQYPKFDVFHAIRSKDDYSTNNRSLMLNCHAARHHALGIMTTICGLITTGRIFC